MSDNDVFELELDGFDDGFDPLADDAFDMGDEEVDFPVGNGENLKDESLPAVKQAPKVDERPAAERIAELFKQMATRRKTLLKILAHCEQPQLVEEVSEYIAELKRFDKCVYSANEFCSLLERCGAIKRVDEEGAPYVEEDLEPKTVVVDGVEYLEPATPAPSFWVTTPEGMEVVEAENPEAMTQQILEDDAAYLPIYKRILTLCCRECGASAKEIANEVDNDPLLRSPRYYSSRFVEKLNKSDALTWGDKVWLATETGQQALAQLDGVEDEASDRIAAAANE